VNDHPKPSQHPGAARNAGRSQPPPPATIPGDLLDSHHWRPIWQLLHRLDRDIASLYERADLKPFKTRFAGPLIQLSRSESLTITALAARAEVTHSAMSQTVAAMRRAGLVESVADPEDARNRRIRLSEHGRDVADFASTEWRATEASLIELEAELPYPLTQVVRDIEAALDRRPFLQRLEDHLGRQPGKPAEPAKPAKQPKR
jgi:DNA-binding MarR family transcriptional regulator